MAIAKCTLSVIWISKIQMFGIVFQNGISHKPTLKKYVRTCRYSKNKAGIQLSLLRVHCRQFSKFRLFRLLIYPTHFQPITIMHSSRMRTTRLLMDLPRGQGNGGGGGSA